MWRRLQPYAPRAATHACRLQSHALRLQPAVPRSLLPDQHRRQRAALRPRRHGGAAQGLERPLGHHRGRQEGLGRPVRLRGRKASGGVESREPRHARGRAGGACAQNAQAAHAGNPHSFRARSHAWPPLPRRAQRWTPWRRRAAQWLKDHTRFVFSSRERGLLLQRIFKTELNSRSVRGKFVILLFTGTPKINTPKITVLNFN